MNRKPVEIFSTAFLDLLSCGMGGMIILWMIFVVTSADDADKTSFFVTTFEFRFADREFLSEYELRVDGQVVGRCARNTSGEWAFTFLPSSSTRICSAGNSMAGTWRVTGDELFFTLSSFDSSPSTVLGLECRRPFVQILTVGGRRARRPRSVVVQLARKVSGHAAPRLIVQGHSAPASPLNFVAGVPGGSWALLHCGIPGGNKSTFVPSLPEISASASTAIGDASPLIIPWDSAYLAASSVGIECRVDPARGAASFTRN